MSGNWCEESIWIIDVDERIIIKLIYGKTEAAGCSELLMPIDRAARRHIQDASHKVLNLIGRL
jgi:hypothetical protein